MASIHDALDRFMGGAAQRRGATVTAHELVGIDNLHLFPQRLQGASPPFGGTGSCTTPASPPEGGRLSGISSKAGDFGWPPVVTHPPGHTRGPTSATSGYFDMAREILGWDSCEQRSCGPSRITALGRLETHRAIPQPRSSDRDSKLFQARSFFSCLLGSSSAEKLLGSQQSGLIVGRCLHLYAWRRPRMRRCSTGQQLAAAEQVFMPRTA